MKKMGLIVAILIATTACASFWDGIGLVSKDTYAARDAQLTKDMDLLKQTVNEIAADKDELKKSAAKIDQLQKLISELQTKMNLLPQETLRKLSVILADAVNEADSAAKNRQ